MSNTQHLFRRGNVWYVRKRVPSHLAEVIETREFVRSTGETNLQDAKRASHAILHEFEIKFKEYETAHGLKITDPANPEWLEEQARRIEAQKSLGLIDDEMAHDLLQLTQQRHLRAIGETTDTDPRTAPDTSKQTVAALRTSAQIIAGTRVPTLSERLEEHLKELATKAVNSTVLTRRDLVQDFLNWYGVDVDPNVITADDASRYVAERLVGNGMSPAYNQKRVSNLTTFFRWLRRRRYYDGSDPFEGLKEDLRGSKRGSASSNGKRRPWHSDEIKKVSDHFNGLSKPDTLKDAMTIALYTGMRLNEIYSLEAEDVNVDEEMICLDEGKTESSVRQVPIHADIKPILERLVGNAVDGFLLPGEKPAGRDAKRGHNPSKRFSNAVRRNAEIADKGVVFHSLRNTFMNRMENAGIPESTTQLIVGHARQSLTYGLYSPGVEFEKLKEAISQISYSDIEGLIRENSK